MSRAARSLGIMVAVVCCLVSAAVTPVQAAGQAGAEPSRTATRPKARQPVAPRQQPLAVETLSPSYLRPQLPVRVTGTVHNNTDEVWGDAQVGMLVSASPFTSGTQIAAATRADPYDDFTGEQVLEAGTFDDIGDVPPGRSRSFAFTVPYEALEVSGEEGVYWVGAELRATDGQGGRGSIARTLTFMPLLGNAEQAPNVDLAMLWPMLAPVPWNGRQFIDDSLARALADGGRLRALAELASTADDEPVNWVLDPAVLDAARRMSRGFTVNGRERPSDSDEATAAGDWLELVRAALGSTVALAVPYAHPDVAALAHADIRPGARKAHRAGARVLDTLGVARLGLLWPAGGHADRDVLKKAQEIEADLTMLARDSFADPPAGAVVELPTANPADRAQVPATRPSLVVPRDRSRMGLRAQPGQSTLQWRQLILANTALRSLYAGGARHTAIAMPGPGWWPDDAWRDAELFDGLRVPWIDRVSASALVDRPHPTYDGELVYPRSAARRQLGQQMMTKARRLRRNIRTLRNLFANTEEYQVQADRAFGLSTSAAWRDHRRTGRRVATSFVQSHRGMIDGIGFEAPNFVTLSSNSGRFPVSITNRLNRPVTVDLAVSARDPRMTVAPIAPVTLQRDQRVTVTVLTNSRGVGITTLTARLLTQEGRAFGPVATFQVRTTQIGTLVWVIMGVGGAVLFIAAARRITRRVRSHRRRVRGLR